MYSCQLKTFTYVFRHLHMCLCHLDIFILKQLALFCYNAFKQVTTTLSHL